MPHAIVIGAGVGGLAAALDLVRQGCTVTVLEQAPDVGGKMRRVSVAGQMLDAGPTVFTMRWVFDEIFAAAGESVSDHLTLHPAATLARHAWTDGTALDLFADLERSAAAIRSFAGPAEANGFLTFAAQARRTYETLETPFIRAKLPTALSLARGVGRLGDLLAIKPFQTLWSALGEHMKDPRLRQLFGRYATYCGSSPFLAPATLMLVAHVEQQGVWLVQGGMHEVACALARLVAARGGHIRTDAAVAEITVAGGRATGVRLADGERLAADAVVANADPAALSAGLFGPAAIRAVANPQPRSLSAITWAGLATSAGLDLLRHTVFFSADYRAEFDALARGAVPAAPTVYVCAQDRGDSDAPPPPGPERLLILINAPATGDTRDFTSAETDRCRDQAFHLLARCGLTLRPAALEPTTPAGFNRLFPGTGGALYGPAVHGPMATFRRPGSRTRIPGLYLAGGSTHPGAGVPMAALSGRLAASAAMADLASTLPSRRTATSGGMSTR